jgi:tetratricopeptide (TPR) repeat protein
MSDPQKTVFISYRRSVSWQTARLIFFSLRERGYDVFMDVENIDNGTFDTVILNQIAARVHFLLILTPGSVERCKEPGDWLRREIEHAMDLNRNIVPILAHDFSFNGTESYLTGKLSNLSRYNGPTLYHEYFDAAIEKLCNRFLKQPMYGEIKRISTKEQVEAQRRIDEVINLVVPTEKQPTAEQYFNLGYNCDKKGNYARAIAHYTEALRLNPKYVEAYNNRGIAYFKQVDYQRAIADFNEALRLKPNYVNVYINRGLTRSKLGDPNGAIADYTEALRFEPKNAMAYNNRGFARYLNGDFDGAIADCNEALRIDPNNVAAYDSRGCAYEAKGDYQKALADYDAALRIEPLHEITQSNREILLKKMNRHK